MKKIISMVLCVVLLAASCCVLCGATVAQSDSTTSEVNIPSETSTRAAITLPVKERICSDTTDKAELEALIQECTQIKNDAHELAEAVRRLGYEEENPMIQLAKQEWGNADVNQKTYTGRLETIKAEEAAREQALWGEKMAEYPAATTIWRYLKDLGYNDYVCAGIMGNLMAEVGGQTLNIQWWLKGNGYYGMCQWNKAYCDGVWGADLQGQCDFLRDTIKYEIDTFGKCYQKGFKYDDFLNLTDAKAAALAFAKSYERCGSGSYSIRQQNAIKAYNYFCS